MSKAPLNDNRLRSHWRNDARNAGRSFVDETVKALHLRRCLVWLANVLDEFLTLAQRIR